MGNKKDDLKSAGNTVLRLIPKSMEYLEKTDEERIGYIKRERFIVYPGAQKVLNKLEELLIEPKKSRMP